MAKKDSFEDSLQSLEKIVQKLEDGGLPLEESLKLFQQGREAAKRCSQRLNEVERKIQVLLEDEKGQPILRDFDTDEGLNAPEPPEDGAGGQDGEDDDFPG